jgi:hypothetical protein
MIGDVNLWDLCYWMTLITTLFDLVTGWTLFSGGSKGIGENTGIHKIVLQMTENYNTYSSKL